MAKNEKTTEELMRDRLTELQADLAKLDADAAPLQAEIDALIEQENRLKVQMTEKAEQMRPIKETRASLQNEIGKLARATGGRSTSEAA